MAAVIRSSGLFSEAVLFSQGTRAGEFVFLAQDGRAPNGTLDAPGDAAAQAARALENVSLALESAGLGREDLVSLTVFLTNHEDAPSVAKVLAEAFPRPAEHCPATTLLGVAGLEGGCRVRIDALATTSTDRQPITVPGAPLAIGARVHGVRVGDLFFLSGVDAAGPQGRPPEPPAIESQTREVLDRIEAVLKSQKLGLGDVFRTFMFMTGTEHRPGYRESRRLRYQGIFAEEEFPANSGIYIKHLGRDILLRSVAIAYRGSAKALVTSPKVWLAPGSFSQAFRVGDWLFVSGQDAIREVERTAKKVDVLSPDIQRSRAYEAEAVGDLAGQTEVSLMHVKHILEAAGGPLDDVVKTTVYLLAGQDRARFAAAYQRFFRAHRKDRALPAGLTVEVKGLAPDCLVEIDAVAYLKR